jgi:hypothetical protein
LIAVIYLESFPLAPQQCFLCIFLFFFVHLVRVEHHAIFVLGEEMNGEADLDQNDGVLMKPAKTESWAKMMKAIECFKTLEWG